MNFMRTWRPDVVHTHRQKENILGAFAARAAHSPASVRTAHGAPEFNYPVWQLHKRALRRLDAWVARHLQQRVIAVSDELGAKLRRNFHGAAITVVPNGIDVEAVRRAASPAAKLEPGLRHIVFVGRLVPVKRVDVFLQTAARLFSSFPGKYRFHVVGDGPLRVDLQQMASDLGISGDCVFHGFLPDAPRWLASMDCLVLTSDHEGLPMTALEARALGIPVVAHAVGGLVTLLENDADCRLVPLQSPAAIAACIRDVTESTQRGARTNALREPYSIEATVRSHVQLYADLLPGGHQQLVETQ